MPLSSITRSAVRFVAPALLACVSVATVRVPVAGAAPFGATASPVKPPKRATRTTTARKRVTPAKRTAARRAGKAEETPPSLPSLPNVPVVPNLPTLTDLLAGRSAAATAGSQLASVVGSAGVTGVADASAPSPLAAFGASASRLLTSMVDRARSQLGTRYVFGGEKPGQGLDCSSFARFAMEAMGIALPRTAAQQAQVGQPVPRDRAKLLPGDLLTFGRGSKVSHVGIYLGEGRFIHASVKSRKIIETTIDRNPSLFKRWQGARRLIAVDDSAAKGRDG